jgi:hypothetical protein
MLWTRLFTGLLFSAALVFPVVSWAAHPLITDDTGTQGKGKFQLELNGQYEQGRETFGGVDAKTTGGLINATLSYGLVEKIDLILTLPYEWEKAEGNGAILHDERGFSDTVLEVKWRFFEKDGLSFALKPGIRFPTGNQDKHLGSGKVGGHLFLIGSKELGPWAFHANLSYIRDENEPGQREDSWHASFAVTREIVKNVRLVADIGQERNPYVDGKSDPAFVLGGIIYTVAENIDVDCGIKFGFNSSETDYSLLAGITIRF